MKNLLTLLLLLPTIALAQTDAIKEIARTENAFMEMTRTKGIAEAFHHFADESAVIKRENDTLIKGRQAIFAYYKKIENASVSWTPDAIEVSNDGTMGSSYGKYEWTVKDQAGKTTIYTGVFHTVWKKQPDGSWKYIWD